MRHRRGFTLPELLVVTGIMALLTGLLLPALFHAKGAGRLARSQSNLRQMALAAQQYSALWDAWPCALRFANPGVFTTIGWDWILAPGMEPRPGHLWSLVGNPHDVLQDPAWPGPTGDGAEPFTGYNYNTSYIGGEATFPHTGWDAVRPGIRPAHARRPATTALFGCGGRRGDANRYMRAPGNREGLALATIYSGGQAFRHVGGCTPVAWLDGHVSTIDQPREGVHASPALLTQFMNHPANGFLTDDDRLYDPR